MVLRWMNSNFKKKKNPLKQRGLKPIKLPNKFGSGLTFNTLAFADANNNYVFPEFARAGDQSMGATYYCRNKEYYMNPDWQERDWRGLHTVTGFLLAEKGPWWWLRQNGVAFPPPIIIHPLPQATDIEIDHATGQT